MAPLTQDRKKTYDRSGDQFEFDVAAGAEIFGGALVVLNSLGDAEPGSTATGKISVGRCEEYVKNDGAAGDVKVKVLAGVFPWENAGSPIDKSHIGGIAYVVDDQSVSDVADGKSPAGRIIDVNDEGVWVKTEIPATSVGLLAANDLSDVGTAATARTNLGLGAASAVTHASLKLLDDAASPVRKVAKVAVTATEIRTLAAAPKTLVAGVAGKAFVFLGALVKYIGGANPFDSVGAGEDLAIRYTNGAGQIVSPAIDTTTDINLGATDDDESWLPPLATVVNPVTAAALVLDNVGGGELASTDDDSDGDGTLEVIIHYDEYTI